MQINIVRYFLQAHDSMRKNYFECFILGKCVTVTWGVFGFSFGLFTQFCKKNRPELRENERNLSRILV